MLPSLEFFNFTLVRMDLVASGGSVKWLFMHAGIFCANSMSSGCMIVHTYRVVRCLVVVECNSLHKVTTLVLSVWLYSAVNIINDCCSSIQAILQLSCEPQVPSWGGGVRSNHPNLPCVQA